MNTISNQFGDQIHPFVGRTSVRHSESPVCDEVSTESCITSGSIGGAARATSAAAYAHSDSYRSRFHNWQNRAGVRVKACREIGADGTHGFYVPELVPMLDHLLVAEQGPRRRCRLLVHSLFSYLHSTIELEHRLSIAYLRPAAPQQNSPLALALCFSQQCSPAHGERPRHANRLRGQFPQAPIRSPADMRACRGRSFWLCHLCRPARRARGGRPTATGLHAGGIHVRSATLLSQRGRGTRRGGCPIQASDNGRARKAAYRSEHLSARPRMTLTS